MNRKVIILSISAVLVLAAIVLAVALSTSAGDNAMTGSPTETKAALTGTGGQGAASSDKEAAAKLIGESLTREQILAALGEWEKFEMSSKGCERGVFAGNFYYKGFMIFSRTYNKGGTFTIVSVN